MSDSSGVDLKQRYWVFDISEYYPSGGLLDVERTFDDREAAKAFATEDTDRAVFDADERKYLEDDEAT